MDDDKYKQQILARLDILIRLLLNRPEQANQRNISEMAVDLDSMGLAPAEIGAILGKPSNYVSATLTSKKRAKGAKKSNG